MTTEPPPLFIDATMLYRWRSLAPVGIVRLERMLANHLRFGSKLGVAQYVIWDRGYRHALPSECQILDELLQRGSESAHDTVEPQATHMFSSSVAPPRGVLPAVRRVGLRAIARTPGHLRPFAEQAAWSLATLGVETARYARRARQRRTDTQIALTNGVRHVVDFTAGGDLVALGLGWEYLDHEALYRLRRDYGVRIHMPGFDLIPVSAPHLNAGQSHLVHRFYAEMAHYADTVTSISEATRAALSAFYEREELPAPLLLTNPLPAFDPPSQTIEQGIRRHRFSGEPFVLTVSTIEVRKNHLLLAKIWAECVREGVDMPRLVLVGRIGWDVHELMQWAFNCPELNDRFSILTDVDDDELVNLYADSLFTVFPSRLEGWGLPITESMALGKACLHSTDPAQFEASQGLMPAFHPDDFMAWKTALLRAVLDPDYIPSLERLIADKYVRRSTSEYCLAYEQILAERRSAA
jgi:glycosyltransferase involved in cell wall biosynthesis